MLHPATFCNCGQTTQAAACCSFCQTARSDACHKPGSVSCSHARRSSPQACDRCCGLVAMRFSLPEPWLWGLPSPAALLSQTCTCVTQTSSAKVPAPIRQRISMHAASSSAGLEPVARMQGPSLPSLMSRSSRACVLSGMPGSVRGTGSPRPDSGDSHRQLRVSRWPASVGAAAIAKGLSLAPRLRFLDLSRCGIRAKGLAALSDALRQGGALQVQPCMTSSGAVAWVAVVHCRGSLLVGPCTRHQYWVHDAAWEGGHV